MQSLPFPFKLLAMMSIIIFPLSNLMLGINFTDKSWGGEKVEMQQIGPANDIHAVVESIFSRATAAKSEDDFHHHYIYTTERGQEKNASDVGDIANNKSFKRPRLELLHIPKTGGTMLEDTASKNGISWGACHFDFPWRRNRGNPLKDCPPLKNTTFVTRWPLWHIPLQFLPPYVPFDPYDNIVDDEYAARSKKFFTVVRNPYDRLISLYYMDYRKWKGRTSKNNSINDPREMNNLLQTYIERGYKRAKQFPLAPFTQYDYVYNENGTPMVDHVLHFEDIHAEFEELRTLYGLNFSLPARPATKKVGARVKNKRVLNSSHLHPELVKLINEVYDKDFEIGGYEKLPVPDVVQQN